MNSLIPSSGPRIHPLAKMSLDSVLKRWDEILLPVSKSQHSVPQWPAWPIASPPFLIALLRFRQGGKAPAKPHYQDLFPHFYSSVLSFSP